MGTQTVDVRAGVVLWLRLARVYGRLSRAANNHIKTLGLTPAQFDVIAQAGATPGLTQGELAKRLLVTEGNITQLLDRMEDVGLAQRRREGRTNRVTLTAAGEDIYQRHVAEHEELMASQLSLLTAEEREQLAALLRKLERGMRRHTAG